MRYYRENRLYFIAKSANSKAAKLGLSGILTPVSIKARMEYFDHRCWVCGGHGTTIDHVLQMSLGGANWPSNIRPACLSCNTRRNVRPTHLGGA